MMRFHLQLLDRRARLCVDGRDVDCGLGTEWPYRTVQESVDRAFSHGIAKLLNIQPQAIVGALEKRDISLELDAETRERDVARLHAYLAYGIPFGQYIVGRPLEAESFFETYQFSSDRQVIEAVDRLLAEWSSVLTGEESELKRWKAHEGSLKADLGILASGEPRPVTIGVVGVTGAGKSSFINAVLGRSIAPRSSAICTAVITELHWTPSSAQEYFEVQWLPKGMIEERARERKEKGRTYLSVEDNERRKSELAALERGLGAMADSRRQKALTDLPKFICVGPDSVADAVARVSVHLHHPLLRHVTLIDTPGLRDPDPIRRRLAIDAAASMDAWVYLAKAPDKPESSMIESDWRQLREQAHNDAGVLVLTKADLLGANSAAELKERRSSYRTYGWREDIEHCAAELPALLCGTSAWEERVNTFWHHGPSFLATQSGLGRMQSDSLRARLGEWMDLAGTDREARQVATDYVLDASGVPVCVRLLGTKVLQSGLAKRRQRGLEGLGSEVVAALARVRNVREREQRNLEICTSLSGVRAELEARGERLRRLERDVHEAESRLSLAKKTIAKAIESLPNLIARDAPALKRDMLEALKESVTEAASGELSGERQFDVFGAFDAPLASKADTHIAKLARKVEASLAKVLAQVPEEEIRSATAATLQPYSLHAWEKYVVEDYEKVLEFFSTTMERMKGSAAHHAGEAVQSITENAAKRLAHMATTSEGVVLKALQHLKDEATDLRRAIKELGETERRLKQQAPSDRELYSTRLRLAEEFLAKVEAFASAHFPGAAPPPAQRASA